MTELAQQPEVRLALDNDALFRVAESLIYLRRYRGLTQQALARKMGTSQAKVARIEGGRENVTLRTLERVVRALEGRLGLSIAPAEIDVPRGPSWWNAGEEEEAGSRYRLRVARIARGARTPPRRGQRRSRRTRG
jgi:transcriptional regulator with XRE-family HTH domain